MPFVFDTNSFQVIENYYPDRFPTFWDNFNEAVASETVISVREVYNELQYRGRAEWFLEWAKQHKQSFLKASAAETAFVAEIFRVPHFQSLLSREQILKGFSAADPFIIACARVREGCVVTEEALKPNAARIPNVCQHFGVECTSVEGFLDRMGWKF